MMQPLLIKALKQPQIIKEFVPAQWSILLQQLRAAQVSLYFLNKVEQSQLLTYVPEKIQQYLFAEQIKIEHQKRQVIYEVNKIENVFKQRQVQAIFLKGVAYILDDLPIGAWRLFSDIDILVNKTSIESAELALKLLGFVSQKTNDYDQHYYREFMHEIPPMQHTVRGSVIDLHHNILPTCHVNPVDIELFKRTIKPCKSYSDAKVFADEALFLHSAVHLFHEGEFDKGLRDLCDLAEMYHFFSNKKQNFSQELIQFAKNTGQQHSLFLAFRYIEKILNVTLSEAAVAFNNQYLKSHHHTRLVDFIFMNVLVPHQERVLRNTNSLAFLFAYIRGHLLRMPLTLLIPHLLKKSWLRMTNQLSDKESHIQDKQRPDI